MVVVPRRLASELLVLYYVERDVPDLFVEGPLDRALVEAIIDEPTVSHNIFTVDEVDFDIEGITGIGGARGRLVTFSTALANREHSAPFCLIDRDYDVNDDPAWRFSNLLVTEHACLDLHVYNAPKVVALVKRAFLKEVQLDELESVHAECRFAFGLRVYNARSATPMSVPSIERSLELGGKGIMLDKQRYLSRYDNMYQNSHEYGAFVQTIESVVAELPSEKLWMNIHDMEEALGFLLRKRYNIPKGQLGIGWLCQLLRFGASDPEIWDDPLIVALAQRMAR